MPVRSQPTLPLKFLAGVNDRGGAGPGSRAGTRMRTSSGHRRHSNIRHPKRPTASLLAAASNSTNNRASASAVC